MPTFEPIPPAALFRGCDPASFPFETTAELPELDAIVGQDRAVEAVQFAIQMRREGYNLFALGPEGIGKHTVIRQYLASRAARDPVPSDWCYVHDFEQPQKPRALRLPAGRGAQLRDDMARFATEIRSAIPAAFDSEQYRNRKEALEEQLKKQRENAIADLEQRARELDVVIIRTPVGVGFAPARNGEVIGSEEFKRLPEVEQRRLTEAMKIVEAQLEETLRKVPRWEREHREKVRQLDREVTKAAVDHLIDELRGRYADLPAVVAYLEAVEADVVDNAAELLTAAQAEGGGLPAALRSAVAGADGPVLKRYQVNLLVDNSATTGAPVVYEDHPTYQNLVGRVEYLSQLGALVTDFTLVKPGALHRANGGYLVLDARDVLLQPYAWEGLKRAIRSREIRIESLGQALSLISTVSLEPEPIPLDLKIALVGDRLLYYLLCEHDPDFLELFKVQADFEEEIDRSPETDLLYAQLIGTIARREGMRPLDRGAVARVIEQASRLISDAEKLSTHMRSISDLVREADHWAGDAGKEHLTADDVQRAIDARLRRAGRLRERVQEAIRRGTILIDTDGARVGQVNGLSVTQLGELAFGMPTRITARVRLGRGDVVDIEREVELGGPIHSKGVLILAGFLGGRFAAERPLTLHASLVFEQSYSGVEGDSASLAELCALLSSLSGLPIRQDLAITGSVNQHGAVQPIGGVNEKIEGFFDVCVARGLTGRQGVVIPAANRKNLMLRRDVVEAAEAGRFHVYAVETVDEAIALLTGRPAGEPGEDGTYPADSVNGLVEARLVELAELAREYAREAEEEGAVGAAGADPPSEPGS